MKKPLFLSLVTACLCFSGISHSLQAQTSWGNSYMLGNANTASVNSTISQWVTFTATEDMEISAAQIYNGSAITTATPELTVAVRAVDGNGVPTGAALTSNTLTPATTAAQTWHRVTLPSVSLTAGQVYALQVSTATPSASYPWRLNAGPTGGIQPYGDPDDNFLRGNNNNNPAIGSNVWLLETNLGRAVGQPYTSTTPQSIPTANTTTAQRFVFDLNGAGGNSQLEAVTVMLGIVDAPPAQPVTIKLINATGTVLATAALDLSGEALGARLYTFDLNTPIQLTDGDAYYLGMYSNGSTGGSVTWYGWNTVNSAQQISASFQGDDAYAVTWASQSNYTTAPAITNFGTRDYHFELTLVPEPSSLALLTAVGVLGILRRRRKA